MSLIKTRTFTPWILIGRNRLLWSVTVDGLRINVPFDERGPEVMLNSSPLNVKWSTIDMRELSDCDGLVSSFDPAGVTTFSISETSPLLSRLGSLDDLETAG